MATEQDLFNIAVAFINAFKTFEPGTHVSLRAANCTHVFAPSSVSQPPPMTNQDWIVHLSKLDSVLDSFPVTTKEIHINLPKRQAIIWATAIPKFRTEVKEPKKDGGDDTEWNEVGEYIFLLDMDEQGKITRIVEFLDSLVTERVRKLMVKAWENAGVKQKLFEG
ncbi:hypothetical protein K461DRAFT_282075 [Myriangium duriaei CBS 260.36]|uniref:Uncharacterized protein n=1 Tax=Myriangium duriaei CBS 260.36 TaxID=1168546 RepID=A0A9P4IU35_9PEZI|nr:hypothetical protein K461DRAFT_282075 [Myriangium duriaei CBS 260.36]